MTNDVRAWGDFGAFMCVHQRTCPKAKYARAIIAWVPALGNAMDQDNLRGQVLRGLHWLTPLFIGPRIVQCLVCGTLTFKSVTSRQIMKGIRFVFDPNVDWYENILLMAEDVDAWGDEFSKKAGLEVTKH